MKLQIQNVASRDNEQLRTLLIDAVDELVGQQSRLLEAKLPWDGHPLLLADAEGHPVLVSFDLANSQAALVNGLVATEQLSAALPWINQVYEPLRQLQKPPRLVIVSTEPPPGSTALLANCPNLSLFNFRILNINGETGLLLERTAGTRQAEKPAPEPKALPTEHAATTPRVVQSIKLPALSEEESTYFQQL